MVEGIKLSGHPGTKERSKTHTCLIAFGTTRPSADFASDDQWANTAFSKIVMRRDCRHRHKDKQLWQKLLDAFTQRMLRGSSTHIGLTQLPELLFKGTLLCLSLLRLFAGREARLRTVLSPSDGPLIDVLHRSGPGQQVLIVRELLFEIVHST